MGLETRIRDVLFIRISRVERLIVLGETRLPESRSIDTRLFFDSRRRRERGKKNRKSRGRIVEAPAPSEERKFCEVGFGKPRGDARSAEQGAIGNILISKWTLQTSPQRSRIKLPRWFCCDGWNSVAATGNVKIQSRDFNATICPSLANSGSCLKNYSSNPWCSSMETWLLIGTFTLAFVSPKTTVKKVGEQFDGNGEKEEWLQFYSEEGPHLSALFFVTYPTLFVVHLLVPSTYRMPRVSIDLFSVLCLSLQSQQRLLIFIHFYSHPLCFVAKSAARSPL